MDAYKHEGRTVKYVEQANLLPALKRPALPLSDIYFQVLQDCLKRLDTGIDVGIETFAAPARTVTFLLRPSDNSGDLVKTVSVAPNGVFQLSNVPRKNYTIRIKGDRYLAAKVNNVDASGGNVSGVMALLKAGDANNDNAADIADLLFLINAYNKISPNAGYLAAADFDLDGSNDIADLLLLIANYNQLGEN